MLRRWLVTVVAGGVLAGCSGTPERGRPGWYGRDSLTAACQRNPKLCSQAAGEEALLPGAARPIQVTASVGTTGSVVVRALTQEQQSIIEEALEECANDARSVVILRHFPEKGPTPEECNEEVEKIGQKDAVTRAMWLGTEMHEVALACTQERLGRLRPGRFSLEPCYLYDPNTEKWELISREKEQSLARHGPRCELKGSLVPDVVIHTGDPSRALAVYDFKFPCANTSRRASWRTYPEDHPHADRTQDELYSEALSPTQEPRIVMPRMGVIR
ncbi:hypothetical protein ACLESO_37400 [Pyxidicoccus sp. 3LG]